MKRVNLLFMIGLFSVNLFAQIDTISTHIDSTSKYVDSILTQVDTISSKEDIISTQNISITAKVDSIFLTSGEVLLVNTKEIAEKSLKYSYPNEDLLNTISLNSVSKIKFKSGRVQEFASILNLKTVKSCLDWKKVQITNIESEISGLFKIDNVGTKAKGITTLSGLSKLQDRAYSKLKMQSAMLGGNTIYIINQHSEDAIYGGQWRSSKSASIMLSGICYASSKVFESSIIEGEYNIRAIVSLPANVYNLQKVFYKPRKIHISKDNLTNQNGFLIINNEFPEVEKVKQFTIIHADKKLIVLSGINIERTGKKTYYNIFLEN